MHTNSCVAKVAIKHQDYGCDSGCCGHTIYAYDCNGVEVSRHFEFSHPYDDDKEIWAKSLADHSFPGVELDLLISDIQEY